MLDGGFCLEELRGESVNFFKRFQENDLGTLDLLECFSTYKQCLKSEF